MIASALPGGCRRDEEGKAVSKGEPFQPVTRRSGRRGGSRHAAAEHPGRASYLNYVTPGILLMTVAAAVQATAIVVAMDMTGGIIDRFRTMAIARSAVLT